MRIIFFVSKKKQKQTKKRIRTNLRFFSSENKRSGFVFQQRKVLLQQFFTGKSYLKNSIKLMRIFFCCRLGEDFFRHPHFKKREYYSFFWPKNKNNNNSSVIRQKGES